MLPFKRIGLSIIFFLFIALMFAIKLPSVAHAQSYTSPNSYMDMGTDPGVPQNLHTYSHSMMLNFLSFLSCVVSGVDPLTQNHKCLGLDSKTGLIGYVEGDGGLLGFTVKAITLTYNIPIHTTPYIKYLAHNFHYFSDKSYAANANEIGVGATGLDPLLKLWVGFRNTAYLFIVIIFVILGFLIMLRFKIDPRTVMTIQNQIPKIVVGILLITFSFAIAGFLIDLMYVSTYLILNITNNAVPGSVPDISAVTSYSTPFDAVDKIFPGGIFGAVNAANGSLSPTINGIINGILPLAIVNWVFIAVIGLISSIFSLIGCIASLAGLGNCSAPSVEGLVGIILWIVLLFAVFAALFKFWIALITCYINIIFQVILGPMRILFGIAPGGIGGGISGWFKDIIANLAVFPMSVGFIVLAAAISKSVSNGNAFTPFFVPGTGLGGVVAFAAILMLPKIPDQVKEWFKVKDGMLGGAIGASVGAGVGFFTGASKRVGGSIKNTVFRAPDPYRHIQGGLGWKLLDPTANLRPAKTPIGKGFNALRSAAGSGVLRAMGINPKSFKSYQEAAGESITHATK